MENKKDDTKKVNQDIKSVKKQPETNPQKIEDTIPAMGKKSEEKSLSDTIPTVKSAGDNKGKTINPAFKKPFGKKGQRSGGRKGGSRRNQKRSPYEESVVAINRVSKTTKGGRRMSFNALVVVGDKKGKVGYAIAKASEVPAAIKKAIQRAQKKVIEVPLVKGKTIPHEITGHAGAGKVFLKNAPEGTGVIAGSAARSVLELAGVKNIYSKVQGSTTAANVVRATFDGLQNLKSVKDVAELRGKDIKDI